MNIFLENIYNLSFFFNTGIGIFSFVCIYILIVLLILPASWLSLLSGFLYGSYLGSIIVFISASIGASIAFFLSKTFFAKKLKTLFSRYPKLSVMEKVVEKGGLKLIFLARLSPIFPFSILNYFINTSSFLVIFIIRFFIWLIFRIYYRFHFRFYRSISCFFCIKKFFCKKAKKSF